MCSFFTFLRPCVSGIDRLIYLSITNEDRRDEFFEFEANKLTASDITQADIGALLASPESLKTRFNGLRNTKAVKFSLPEPVKTAEPKKLFLQHVEESSSAVSVVKPDPITTQSPKLKDESVSGKRD